MISCKTPEKIDQNRIRSQQWLYAFVGLLTTIPILLVTIVEIRKNDEQIVVSLVFLVQTMSVIGSILFTAFRCRTSDALLTILTILFLVAYVTIHFYIRFFFNHSRSNENFLHLTLRVAFVLILFILFLPWTSILIYTFKNNDDKQTISPRANLFFWFLKLDFIFIISSFTLTIRKENQFDQIHLLFIALAISLASLWLSTGTLSTRKTSRHWLTWTVFYLLSISQILYLFYVVSLISFVKINDFYRFSLSIITFICVGSNFLTHILTIIISCSLIGNA